MNEQVSSRSVASDGVQPISPAISHAELPSVVKVSLVGLFMLALTAALFFAQDFLLPVSLAFLFALALSPIVRFMSKRHVPAPFTAIAVVGALLCTIFVGAYSLAGPVSHWMDNAPQMGRVIQSKVAVLLRPMEAMKQATEQVERITEGTGEPATVREVVVREPGLLSQAASGVPEIVAQIGLTLVLLLFLLASGDLFYEKLVKALPTLSDKKRALKIARSVELEVSRYLSTIFFINLAFGAWIALGMWLAGMPNPLLWGAAAAVLNFIPYIGAVIGTILVAIVGLVTFDNVSQALIPPAIYIATTTIEGHFLTPMIVGRRLELNSVVVFLAVAFWGWLWGIVGALIAVPMLVVAKVFTDHVEGLAGLGEFLSERHIREDEEEVPSKAPAAPA